MKHLYLFLLFILVLGCSKSSDIITEVEETPEEQPVDGTDDGAMEPLDTSFTLVLPNQAFLNDEVSIIGENIDTSLTHQVKVGDIVAEIRSVTETEIRFLVSENMTNGIVSVTFNGEETLLEPLDILQENAILYGILKESDDNSSIVKIDPATGQIIETLLSGTTVNLKFTKFEYAPSINSLVIICDSMNSHIEQSYGLLNLDTGSFSHFNPKTWDTLSSSIEDIEISSQGRVFASNHQIVFELDIATGEVVENSIFFYSYEGHPSLQELVYSEFEGKIASSDLNIDFNQQYLIIYNLNTQNTSVLLDRGMSKSTFNKDTGAGYGLGYSGILYSRPSFLQSSSSILFETGLENRSNYDRFTLSYDSNRLFFIAENPDNTAISYLGRYHIPTNSYNQVQINELLIDIDIAE